MRFGFACAFIACACDLAQAQGPLKTGPSVRALAFSPDGKYLAAAGIEREQPGQASVWELPAGKLRFEHKEAKGVPAVAFSPDGKRLVLGSITENAIVVDTATWTIERHLPGHGAAARGLAFSHDSKTLAVTSYDGFIRLWDVPTWSVKQTFQAAHTGWIFAAAISKDGKTLASCGEDNKAKLWDLATGKTLHTFEHGSIVRRILFTPDDRHVAYASWDGTLAIRDRSSGEYVLELNRSADDLAISSDGKMLAVVAGPAMILPLDLRPADEAMVKQIHRLIKAWDDDDIAVRDQASADLAALGPAARKLVAQAAKEATTPEARLRARLAASAIRTAKPRLTLPHAEGRVQSVAFSPDGQTLATGGPDGIVRLWDVATGRETRLLRQWAPAAPPMPRSEY